MYTRQNLYNERKQRNFTDKGDPHPNQYKQLRQENCRPLVTAPDQRNHKESVPLHPIISIIGSYPDNTSEYLARSLVK